MKQGDKLKAIKPFRYLGNEGKTMLVKTSNRFEIVTDSAFHKDNQGHCLVRAGRGRLAPRWFFTDDQLCRYFKVVENDEPSR